MAFNKTRSSATNPPSSLYIHSLEQRDYDLLPHTHTHRESLVLPSPEGWFEPSATRTKSVLSDANAQIDVHGHYTADAPTVPTDTHTTICWIERAREALNSMSLGAATATTTTFKQGNSINSPPPILNIYIYTNRNIRSHKPGCAAGPGG